MPAVNHSSSPNATIGALINLNGKLCAEVVRITKLQRDRVYEVECTLMRGGSARGSYAVDLNTGRAERL